MNLRKLINKPNWALGNTKQPFLTYLKLKWGFGQSLSKKTEISK